LIVNDEKRAQFSMETVEEKKEPIQNFTVNICGRNSARAFLLIEHLKHYLLTICDDKQNICHQ
jgi:hypothetical protein